MAASVKVVLYPPTEHEDIVGLLDRLARFRVDLQTEPRAVGDAPGSVVLAALKRDDELWLFWIADGSRLPLSQEQVGIALFSTLALQSDGIFVWPRDDSQLDERLRQLRATDVEEHEDHALRACREYGLIGYSEPFCRALRLIARLARYDVPVLLEGETGTGKELFARALHYRGTRSAKPFVPVNCAALPDTLLENELFGHTRGAFTDARNEQRGLVAQADGGTLFFDEVHCLSPKGQATILRFLQDQQYRPLGTERLLRADVRIVAATNRVLDREVAQGAFREDLLYRLRVATVRLPALRERPEDIPLLAENALGRLCARYGVAPRRFDAESLAWLSTCTWPGNVRELENFVCRALVLSEEPVIHLDHAHHDGHCPRAVQGSCQSFKEARAHALSEFETRYLSAMLSMTCGNVSEAARRAGKDRRVFGKLMKKHGIDRQAYSHH